MKTTLLSSLVVLVLFSNGSHASCSQLYAKAALALDQKRAQCGLSSDKQNFFCSQIASIQFPISAEGFNFQLTVGSAYRFLNSLHLLPNQFRKVSKLLAEASVGRGTTLNTVHSRVARVSPSITVAQVASLIRDLDKTGALCENNVLTDVRGVQMILEAKL